MGTEISDEEFEFNDLTISAVCEVMNQMMGAASTALSDFLGRSVNISTPSPSLWMTWISLSGNTSSMTADGGSGQVHAEH